MASLRDATLDLGFFGEVDLGETSVSVGAPPSEPQTIFEIAAGETAFEFDILPPFLSGAVSAPAPFGADNVEGGRTLFEPDAADQPPELRAFGRSDPFAALEIDVDAVVLSILGGAAGNVISNALNFEVDAGFAEASVELADFDAELGLALVQNFDFTPQINLEAEVRRGEEVVAAGDTAALGGGLRNLSVSGVAEGGETLDLDVAYSLSGTLRNRTGVIVTGVTEATAGAVSASLTVLGRTFPTEFTLFEQEFPEGGFEIGAPVFLFDRTFELDEVARDERSFEIDVIEREDVVTPPPPDFSGDDIFGAGTIDGTADDDVIFGNAIPDVSEPGGFVRLVTDDVIFGGDGDDRIEGRGGADALRGGAGRDGLFGERQSALHRGERVGHQIGRAHV